MPLKLKKAYENHVIGFNNSSLPLGKRKDLHVLYEKAKNTNNKKWLEMFDEVPTQQELDKIKEDLFKEKNQPVKKDEKSA